MRKIVDIDRSAITAQTILDKLKYPQSTRPEDDINMNRPAAVSRC